MSRAKSPFHIVHLAPRRWFACHKTWHRFGLAWRPHRLTLRNFYGWEVTGFTGRTPFEALERLKRARKECRNV